MNRYRLPKHLFIFADVAAQARHGQSEAVKCFESVYSPELVRGEVVFTDYGLISGKPTPEQWASRQNLFKSSAAAPFFKVRCMRS